MNKSIGETAGLIWRLLKAENQMSVSGIVKKAKCSQPLAHMALGWLAREDKIVFERSTRGLFVSLKDEPGRN